MSARRPTPRARRGTPVATGASNPTPVLTSLGASSVSIFSGAQAGQTANGSGFVASSVVNIDGVAATTAFVNSTQLTFTIPNTVLWTNGAKAITVVSPGPGGGTSNAQTYTVQYDAADLEHWGVGLTRTVVSGAVSVLTCMVTGDSNKDFTQASAPNQGVLNAADAGYNGQDTISVTSNTRYKTGTLATPQPANCTYFWVGEISSPSTTFFDGIDGSHRQVMFPSASLQTQLLETAQITGTSTSSAKKLIIAEFGSSGSIRTNNITTTEVTGSTGSQTALGLTLFQVYTNQYGMTGKFAEMICVSGYTSSGRRAEIANYLGNRFGITVAP